MSVKTEISEKRSEPDKWFGIKFVGNSSDYYVETQTTTCELCGAARRVETEVTELIHVPSTLRRIRVSSGPIINRYVWGYKRTGFYACESHAENELDHYVSSLKGQPSKRGEP